MPEAIAHLRAEALVDGALHAALHRSPERLPPFTQQFRLQAVPPLTDHRAGGGPRLDLDSSVGGQPVFPPAIQNGADTAGEAAHRQGDRRDGKHQTTLIRSIPKALGPEVLAGKRVASVCFDVSDPVGEIQTLAVQFQRSTQRMPHADDAVGALHPGEETERLHDVRPQSSKRTIA